MSVSTNKIQETLCNLGSLVQETECTLREIKYQEQTKFIPLYKWSKNGWVYDVDKITYTPKTFRNNKYHSLRTFLAEDKEDFESKDISPDVAMMQSVQKVVQYEPPCAEIDSLPNNIKDMVQHADEWIIKGNSLYKILDPITQIQNTQNWGTDTDDEDTEVLCPRKTITRWYLEELCLISEDQDTETVINYLMTVLEKDSPLKDTPLYDLSDYDKNCIAKLFDAYVADKENATVVEIERLLIQLEYDLDYIIGRNIALKIDLDICGGYYSSPSTQFQWVAGDMPQEAKECKEEREKFFFQLLAETFACSSYRDLYGTTSDNKDGIYGKIRGMNQHDRDLVNKFSDESKSNAIQKFIYKWMKAGKDEDLLKVALKYEFHNKDSKWNKRKQKEFQNLFLTKTQWNSIYSAIKNVKHRIRLNRKPDESRFQTLKLLRKHYKKIETFNDLSAFERWAYKREIKDNKILQFSKIDKISIFDEFKFRKALSNRKKELLNKYISCLADNFISTATILPTNHKIQFDKLMPISCFSPKCSSMLDGDIIKIEINKKVRYVTTCSDCGKSFFVDKYIKKEN